MTSQQVSDKNEKSLAERLIVIVIFSSLMAIFIFHFFKNQAQISRIGFESASHIFSSQVNGIRAQWFMDSKPTQVVVKNRNLNQTLEEDENITIIPVNENGWVDVSTTSMQCQNIWQHVMGSPLIYLNAPISTILVTSKEKNYCKFILPTGEYFTYNMTNGKVIFKY